MWKFDLLSCAFVAIYKYGVLSIVYHLSPEIENCKNYFALDIKIHYSLALRKINFIPKLG